MSYNPNNPNGATTSANSAPVVLATDQGALVTVAPAIIAQPTAQSLIATGSIQWQVQGGGFYFLTINNAPASTVAFVATIVFETSIDNSTWIAVNANPLIGLPGAGLAVTSTTTVAGLWKVFVPTTASYVRARVSARTSGTIWAYLEPVSTSSATVQLPFTPTVTAAATILGWIDTTGMAEIALQVSSVTTTVVTVQGTNDPTGAVVQSIQANSDNTSNQTPSNTIASAITGSVVNPVHKWIRFQVTTTGTVFTVQGATARYGQSFKINAAQSSVGIQGTPTVNVATVTKGNLGQPALITDVASAAQTVTVTAGPFTPGFGSSYQISVPVTVVSGTTPTLDVEVQESRDSGVNYVTVYDFPRITAVGYYTSPIISMTGTVIRYIQTISGTTPSFTRSIQRLQSSAPGTLIRQIIDRTIVLTTLSSSTVNLISEISAKNVQMTISIGAATTAPVLQIQGSDDGGVSWYSVGAPLSAVASTTVSLTVNNVTAQFFRATVSTAGSAVTSGYVLLRSF